jgi:hypothetical protein
MYYLVEARSRAGSLFLLFGFRLIAGALRALAGLFAHASLGVLLAFLFGLCCQALTPFLLMIRLAV